MKFELAWRSDANSILGDHFYDSEENISQEELESNDDNVIRVQLYYTDIMHASNCYLIF